MFATAVVRCGWNARERKARCCSCINRDAIYAAAIRVQAGAPHIAIAPEGVAVNGCFIIFRVDANTAYDFLGLLRCCQDKVHRFCLRV